MSFIWRITGSTAPWVVVLTAHGAVSEWVPSRVRTSLHVTTLSFNRSCGVVRTRVASRVSHIYAVVEFIAAKNLGEVLRMGPRVCPLYDSYTIKFQSKCLVKPQHPITYQFTNILTYLTLVLVDFTHISPDPPQTRGQSALAPVSASDPVCNQQVSA